LPFSPSGKSARRQICELAEGISGPVHGKDGRGSLKELLRRVEWTKTVRRAPREDETDPSLQKRIKFAKRLKVLEAFRKVAQAGVDDSRRDPVLSAGVAPLVPLDGGRFATSD